MLLSAVILPCARWLYKKEERVFPYRMDGFVLPLNMSPSTGCCSFPFREVIEGGSHYDLFDNNVKLKGLSGNAVFSCML